MNGFTAGDSDRDPRSDQASAADGTDPKAIPTRADDQRVDHDAVNGSGLQGASRLPLEARRAYVALLTNRFITRSRNRLIWEAVLDYATELRERLADMFLLLEIDRDYEVAFKRQIVDEEAPVVLRRDKSLSRDASFLLIFLRREHAYTDAMDAPVVVSRSQIADYLRPFREEGDLDDAKFDHRVIAAIRSVADLGLLAQDPNADYLYAVSPAVVPLVSLDVLASMEGVYLEALGNTTPGSRSEATGDSGDDGECESSAYDNTSHEPHRIEMANADSNAPTGGDAATPHAADAHDTAGAGPKPETPDSPDDLSSGDEQ